MIMEAPDNSEMSENFYQTHGATTQKTVTFILVTMKIAHPT
jgi:hypothetical protein